MKRSLKCSSKGSADIPSWYYPYVVCFPIFHVVVRLLREDTVLFQGTRIVSLHRWKFPLVNGGFHKLRTKCS